MFRLLAFRYTCHNVGIAVTMNRNVLSLPLLALFLHLCGRSDAATFIVTNTNGSGTGSLRQAILDANSSPEADTIIFQIPGTGVKTINLGSALPALTSPVLIDATTQTGYTGTPLVEINGANAGTAVGLRLLAGGSGVRGLCINRFLAQGIEITGAGTNFLANNYVGTDPLGTTARANSLQGVWISSSFENVVSNNVISGNTEAGIYIIGGGLNRLCGNYVGVSSTGANRLANGANGISVNGSAANRIGSTSGPVNVIAGNSASGIYLSGVSTVANVVQGNIIGLAADGSKGIGNSADGITINNARGNVVGGTDPGARNVISGNGKSGVSISGSAATNTVQGNFIGTDSSGRLPAGNDYAGVTISRATNNLVGGTIASARNVISGNRNDGVFLSTNSVGNTISGNFIGLNEAGTAILSNAYNGVTISSAYSNVLGDGNVISGNAFDGVGIINGASGNIVRGTFIGTDSAGTVALANKRAGIGITKAPLNTIGDPGFGAGNVISGNGDTGIYIIGAAAVGNSVQGNRIGTDSTGMQPLGNYSEGIYIRAAVSNVIGRNVISANGTWGISLTNTDWNVIQANTIGTAIDRFTPMGNSTRVGSGGSRFHTIELSSGCRGNMIGGSAPGAGNLVAYTPAEAGIYYAGIRIRDGSTNNPLLGNTFVGNAGLAIDLGDYLVTSNDDCDGDDGANQLQNFPVITQVVGGGGTAIRGKLNSRPNTVYRLEFFASSATDNFGVGEGEMLIGSKEVATGSSCSADFSATFAVPVPAGYRVSATATDPGNNTSEFSACAQPLPAPVLSVSSQSPGALQLAWPANYTGFFVRKTDSLAPPVSWTRLEMTPATTDGNQVITVPQEPGATRYFQLAFE